MTKKKIGCLILGFFLTTSFFWVDEEKEIAALAKAAQEAMHAKNYKLAQQNYRSVLKRANPQSQNSSFLGWPALIDYSMQLARSCELLGEIDESLAVLRDLLAKHPPTALTPRILLMQARLQAPQQSAEKAYLILRQIAQQLPMELWSKEDLSFFHALSYSLDEYFDAQLRKAKRYYVTGFFSEAIALYQEVLHAIEDDSFPKASLNRELIKKKVRYALAECHFSLAEYEKSLALVEQSNPGESKIDREMLYLMALCYKHKQDYEKTVAYLEQYANSPHKEILSHYDHALFELGFFYYTHEQTQQARRYFELLQQLNRTSRPKILAGFYLARLELQDHCPQKAHKILKSLSKSLPTDDSLKHEFAFLEGEVYYLQADLKQAQKAYEASLPGSMNHSWGSHARLQLVRCYLKLAEDKELSCSMRSSLFDKAENILKSLKDTTEASQSFLYLARLYLLKHEYLSDHNALLQVESLLTQNTIGMSLAQQHEALLLRAEACQEDSQKQMLLAQATASCFASLPSYAEAWYAQGFYEFQAGMTTQKQQHFDAAIAAFEQALYLCHQDNQKLAAKILNLEAKANFYLRAPLSSLDLLEKLLTQFVQSDQEREESLYLRGLIAAGLALDPTYFSLAETSLKQAIENYPNGFYAPEALRILGMLYFQHQQFFLAQDTFLKLARIYPQSTQAAEGLFWAAESLEHLNASDPKICTLRQNLYANYPNHERAAEAYFLLYPYEAYLKGEEQALKHLRHFSILFPSSSLRLTVHYLLGLQIQSQNEAIHAFEEVVKLLPQLTAEGYLPDTKMVHYYYEALHKLALLYLQSPQHRENGIALLQRVIDEFNEPMHPLTSILKQKSTVNQEYAQCAYSLAIAYLDHQQRAKAEKLLFELLTNYRQAGVQEGLYLALSWQEQGLLSMNDQAYHAALNYLDIAEEAGQTSLSEEQKLQLWLLKSECLRHSGEFERSMRYLSKVINAEISSPLKLQAMLLRAEIYQLQNRPELAMRQLEAIIKKGGPWAEQAQQQLKRLVTVQ
ncbi:MAG: tetratricopeptide repeat protein [Verrucomicrobia bacterium]|nr:tetratricopeptide repeat protein [Verrucomicrobiota bacterium]MBS0645131.1 tetratricopeptide repeat protein [Verrucomicrobiota bacterium]